MAKPMDIKDEASRDQFLSRPRFAILATNRREGTPITVPVCFEWDGSAIRMFAASSSPKVRRRRLDLK